MDRKESVLNTDEARQMTVQEVLKLISGDGSYIVIHSKGDESSIIRVPGKDTSDTSGMILGLVRAYFDIPLEIRKTAGEYLKLKDKLSKKGE